MTPHSSPRRRAGGRAHDAELSDAEKNEISHRGRAARMLAAHLAGGGAAPSGR